MDLTAKQRIARQIYLLELEHKHYLKVVNLIKRFEDTGIVSEELTEEIEVWKAISAERERVMQYAS